MFAVIVRFKFITSHSFVFLLYVVATAHLQTRVHPARDVIYVNGNRLPKKQPPKVYFALNKPKGFVTVADALFESLSSFHSLSSFYDEYM